MREQYVCGPAELSDGLMTRDTRSEPPVVDYLLIVASIKQI
jgi:hypothetical protein